MDVVDLMRILLRRWYLVLPVVSLVAVAAFSYSDRIEPEYQAQGSVLLLPPGAVAPDEAPVVNPWQAIGTDATIEALSVLVQSEEFATRTATEVGVAPGDTFSYEVLTENRSAVVTVEATAESPEQAIAAASIVKAGLQRELDLVHEEYGVPTDLRTTFRTLNEPGLIEVLYPGQLQVRIGGLAAGVLLALVIALLGDRVLFWVGRRRRDSADAAAGAASQPPEPAAMPPTDPMAGAGAPPARWRAHSPSGDASPVTGERPATGDRDSGGDYRPAAADEPRTPARAPGA